MVDPRRWGWGPIFFQFHVLLRIFVTLSRRLQGLTHFYRIFSWYLSQCSEASFTQFDFPKKSSLQRKRHTTSCIIHHNMIKVSKAISIGSLSEHQLFIDLQPVRLSVTALTVSQLRAQSCSRLIPRTVPCKKMAYQAVVVYPRKFERGSIFKFDSWWLIESHLSGWFFFCLFASKFWKVTGT